VVTTAPSPGEDQLCDLVPVQDIACRDAFGFSQWLEDASLAFAGLFMEHSVF